LLTICKFNLAVVLGSPSIREGISFKHIQHVHILDPVWNFSAKTQVEGRAIRHCSHIDITPNHAPLRRVVKVHIYKMIWNLAKTCDQRIYDILIPAKQKFTREAETALQKVAIDYYLFRKLYSTNAQVNAPIPNTTNALSDLGYADNTKINVQKNYASVKNSCPKPRRPNIKTGNCPPGSISRQNQKGDDCCYKVKPVKQAANDINSKKAKTACPKDRRPKDGKCPADYELKTNQSGIPCCYKVQHVKQSTDDANPKKAKTACPKDRRPKDGKCPANYELKSNQSGIPCCYKVQHVKQTTDDANPKKAKTA
jgi:hypothetical protein